MSGLRKIVYLLIPFVFVIFVFIGIEIYVRQTRPHVSTLELFVHPSLQDKDEFKQGSNVFVGDVALGWKLAPNLQNAYWDYTTFSTNEQGIRYDKKIQKKNDKTFRILALGDSVTFGYRIPTTWPENPLNFDKQQKPYTFLLENKLSLAYPDKKIEVIPMAVPGYSTRQGLMWLKNDIDKYDPDIVMALFGWNDTDVRGISDKEAFQDKWFDNIQKLIISKSQSLVYTNRWYNNKNITLESISALYNRVSRDEFIENMTEMNEVAKEHNATMIYLGTVYRDNQENPFQAEKIESYRSTLKNMAYKNNIAYIEFPQLMESAYPDNNIFFGELIHPNYLGHQIMAQEIYSYIVEKRYINELDIAK